MKKLMLNKLFLTGFILISSLFLISIFYFIVFKDHIPTTALLFGADGKPLPAPYSYKIVPPFGTDRFARDLLIVMIVGTKYTIAAALIITFLRVFPSIWFGLILHFYFNKLERPIKSIVDSLNYFPMTLFAFLLLTVILRQGVSMEFVNGAMIEGSQPLPYWDRVVMFIVVLAALFVPTNSVLIANEVKVIMNKEFIECSRVLGASNWRIVAKHIKPFLIPQIAIIFIRDFIQSLILMSHLAVLGLFVGGYYFREDLFGMTQKASLSNEWAGLLGMWWEFLWTSYPWISFIPIIFITILILSAKGMMEGLKMELANMDKLREPTLKREDIQILNNVSPFDRIQTFSK
jgi:peptide/nickel transport system permease protein